MNEINSIQLQIEKQATSLSSRIESIYSSLEELSRLTLLLLELTPNDTEIIAQWIKDEQFTSIEGFFSSKKSLSHFNNKSLSDVSVAYGWPSTLKDDSELQHSFYALRNIGNTLKSIQQKLKDVTIIYYQDITKNACISYPFFEINKAIPADFDWSEYHACLSVNPKNNPDKQIQWSPPNIDYAGEGLISIASIPLYQDDRFIGLWSIDVPFTALHQHSYVDTFIPEQTNFITDFEGNIVAHPTISAEINKEKGSFYQKNLTELGEGLQKLNINELTLQEKGNCEIVNDNGEIRVVIYQTIPKINWIMFTTFPKDKVFDSVRDKIINSFNKMKDESEPDEIDIKANSDMQILIDSYNDMIKILAYNQAEKEKAQQKALATQKQLNQDLELLVQQRTKELQEQNIKLEDAKNQLKLITDSLPIIIAYLNKDLRYEMANAYFKELHGIDPEDMLGLHLKDVIGEEGYLVEKPKYDEALSGKTVIREDHFVTKTGIEHWYRITLIPNIINGEVKGIFGLVVDLTELKKAQFQLQELNKTLEKRVEEEVAARRKQEEQLIQQSKDAAMGEMIGVIAHQWKQPLNIIGIITQGLNDKYEFGELTADELQGDTEKILVQINFMSQTINDFRNFFKPSSNLVFFEVGTLVNDVFKLNEAKFKNMAITFTMHEENCFEAFGLPNELKQVIMNIFSNASDVFEERAVVDRGIDVYFETSKNTGKIKLQDNGGGIPEELLPDKLFERYISTKGDKGTGLGLQICRTIIEDKFNGKMWAHNTESGAEFVIELPLERK